MLVILAWLMFSLHVIFSDFAEDITSNNPCGQTTQVVNICQFSEIANTSEAFVYISNSAGQNKRTCTCSLSPTSSNVRIDLRYRKQTRSTENINLKINDFAFDRNHTHITTVLTERKELVLNTNPAFNNSEKVCLIITTEDGTGFNIYCSKATNETKIPVTVTRGSEITEMTLEPNHDNGLPSADDNNCGENNVTTIIIPSVICPMLLVIILCFLVYIRRLRRQIVIQHQSDKPTHALQLSVIETLQDPDQVPNQEEKVSITYFNAYERLNMYDNENCSAEMYQQLDVVND